MRGSHVLTGNGAMVVFDVFRTFASRRPTRPDIVRVLLHPGGVAGFRPSQPCTAPTVRWRLNSEHALDRLPNRWIPGVFGLAPLECKRTCWRTPEESGRDRHVRR